MPLLRFPLLMALHIGFCELLPKTWDLPLNFEVELRTDEVLTEAVDRLISKAGKDKAITKVLGQFCALQRPMMTRAGIFPEIFLILPGLLTQETSRPFLKF